MDWSRCSRIRLHRKLAQSSFHLHLFDVSQSLKPEDNDTTYTARKDSGPQTAPSMNPTSYHLLHRHGYEGRKLGQRAPKQSDQLPELKLKSALR